MPDILDDLRAELDSAFARAEGAPGAVQRSVGGPAVPRDPMWPCACASWRPRTGRASARRARAAGRGDWWSWRPSSRLRSRSACSSRRP